MNEKTAKIFFVLVVISSLALVACETRPFQYIELPVHPYAVSVEHMDNQPAKGAKCVVYKVNTEFPAPGIIQFYEDKLTALGLIKAEIPRHAVPMRVWSRFNPTSGQFEKTNNPPGKYISHWVDGKKQYRVWFTIFYQHNVSETNWQQMALAICNIAKYTELPN